MRVGFIGLGTMGSSMALNLRAAGYDMVVHDIRREAGAPHLQAGASWADSVRKVAEAADVVFTSLPGPREVEQVALAADGLLVGMRRETAWFDLSTNSPTVVRRLHAQFAQQGIAMLDAPVSGGPHGAAAGTLSVIVGGPDDTFAAAEDIFRAIGKNVFHVGGHGMGLAMKLINNMLGQIQTVAIAEAMVLGRKAGLDPKQIYEVVSASTGNSVQFQNRVPRILARNFTPGGTLDISFKDQELETAFAKRLGVPLFLANVSQQVYQMGRAAGFSKEDGSSLVKVYEQLAGVKVSGGDGG